MRKVITLSADLCCKHGLSDWRQSEYNVKQLKRLMRIAQNKKRSSAKTEEQRRKRNALVIKAHQEYIDKARKFISKAVVTKKFIEAQGIGCKADVFIIKSINNFVNHAIRQISQIERRVIFGETIPHNEKVFSLFQPHTEWICKGKAGVPVELGLRVCVLEDQYQFILRHHVMQRQTDDQVAYSIAKEAKEFFPNLFSCSFDKGFHSPENQSTLNEILDVVALPRKGKLSKQARAIQQSDDFLKAHYKHSAVESVINALEVHGLDFFPDHGIDGFKHYVTLAVVARNIQHIGALLMQVEHRKEERRKLNNYKKNCLKNQKNNLSK